MKHSWELRFAFYPRFFFLWLYLRLRLVPYSLPRSHIYTYICSICYNYEKPPSQQRQHSLWHRYPASLLPLCRLSPHSANPRPSSTECATVDLYNIRLGRNKLKNSFQERNFRRITNTRTSGSKHKTKK